MFLNRKVRFSFGSNPMKTFFFSSFKCMLTFTQYLPKNYFTPVKVKESIFSDHRTRGGQRPTLSKYCSLETTAW